MTISRFLLGVDRHDTPHRARALQICTNPESEARTTVPAASNAMARRQRKQIQGIQVRRKLDPHDEIFGPDAMRDTASPSASENLIPAELILFGELGQLPPAAPDDNQEPEQK
jgi:hypothetical protein